MLVTSATLSIKGDENESWQSPSGGLEVVAKPSNDPGGKKELWVVSTHSPENQSFLFRYSRTGTVLMSPDETYIAFNYKFASTDSDVVLFRRTNGITFQMIEELDLAEKVKKFFEKTERDVVSLDHWYVECLGWSRDSKALLLKAYGHGKKSMTGWYCIYSPLDKRLSLDLKKMNVGVVNGR